jgi:hypothetical protein
LPFDREIDFPQHFFYFCVGCDSRRDDINDEWGWEVWNGSKWIEAF